MNEPMGPSGSPEAEAAPVAPAAVAAAKPNLLYHAIIGLAIGVIAPFTLLAWPVAMLTGVVIGQSQVDSARGGGRGLTGVARLLAVTGGVLAMLFLGAVIGGLIAFLIVALMAASERLAAGTSAGDQLIARLVVVLVAIATWFVIVFVLRLNLQINLGTPPGA